MNTTLANFTDVLVDEICNSQPLSLSSSVESRPSLIVDNHNVIDVRVMERPPKGTGQSGQFRSTEEIDPKYRDVFSYPYFNLVQSSVIEDALYSDKSIVVCAPTGSGKTVVFEMAIVQLLMELEDKQCTDDFKIIYMAPVKALCTERLTEWYSKFTKLGLLCIEVTGDTDVDFTQLKPYKIIITTPEKWDMLTRRWRDHQGLVEVIKLFLIDEVHILNDETRGPVLEAVVSRMKTIESSAQSVHRIEQLQKEIQGQTVSNKSAPRIRFVAVSATVSNPEDVANWLGSSDKPAVFYKFGDECRPVKLRRIVEGYPCSEGTSIFKFDIILNYKLWPIIQKYHSGKPTLIFCNTRKSVILTAETLSREITITFNAEQKAKLTAIAATIKNKKLQALVLSGVGCHHAGLLYEERLNIEFAFRNRDLPILITTTTLAMGVNLPAHLVIVKNTQQYVNGAYQEYSISTVLQMVGRAGRPQFDTEATAVIMTRLVDKPRYQALVGGCEPLQSYLHKRLAENLNSEAALGTVGDVAQCVQWLRSTFLYVRAARDPKKYLGLPQNSPQHLISKKVEELCVKAMNGLASSGLITMDEASCIESTEAGRLMSIFYLDLETMKQIMKIEGTESLERLLTLICESHELADMHLRVDERRCLNTLNRNNAAATIRFPMKGKISTRQMKLNCIIQAVLGCLSIPDPSLNQEAMKIMRIADRVCKCLVTYVTRRDLISQQPQFYSAVLNSIILAKCVAAHLWENSPFVSKQLKGIGPTFSTLLASAGKVNFMLLEESHPRDLERIINKGAPAGNVLRKQVSLLPKYQLTMIPVDEKTVTIQLVLLNQSYLAENVEQLTAGDSHKSYIIVGDSNNHILLLAVFKDRDLISVFDGTITHEIRRKHNFEHKIFAHCVSSSFVGIDVQAEYLFNDLDQVFGVPSAKIQNKKNEIPTKKVTEKQTCITDTFKERKRKNPDAIEYSKEKKKRENAIIENFKYLKKSFETSSKNVMGKNQNLFNNKAVALLSKASNEPNANTKQITDQINSVEEIDSDEFIDDEKIDSILNEIENEMCKTKINANIDESRNNNPSKLKLNCFGEQNNPSSIKSKTGDVKKPSDQNLTAYPCNYKTANGLRKRKFIPPKSNYNFIDLLERNLNLSDDEDNTTTSKDNGFSDTIKSQIQKYLSKTHTKTNIPDKSIEMLLDKPENKPLHNTGQVHEVEQINVVCERPDTMQPRYEIKEILGSNDLDRQRKNNKVILDENVISIEDTLDSNMRDTSDIEKQDKSKEIKTRSCDTSTDTIIIDYEDSANDYKVKETDSDVVKPVIINISDEICSNDENSYKEDNACNLKWNENNFDYVVCREDDNFREGSENKPNFKSDVIMAGPDKHGNKLHSTNATYETENHTDSNKHNKETRLVIKERNNNPSCVLFNNKSDFNGSNNSDAGRCSDIVPINCYPLNYSNQRSYNDISDADVIGSTIYFNPAQHSKSLCKVSNINIMPSSLNCMKNSPNISHDSPKHIDTNKQQPDYVKRYTYSTSKIDVCTKQTPEYCVQVIKKVKMDLDITAIVSRRHKSFQKSSNNNENCNKYEVTKNIDFPCPQNIYERVTEDVNRNATVVNNDIKNEPKVSLPSPRANLPAVENFNEPRNTVIMKENIRNNLQSQNNKLTRRISGEQNSIAPKMHISKIENEELEVYNRYVENGVTDEKIQQIDNEVNTVNGNNTIKNVLQKYSKILANNSVKTAPPNSSVMNISRNKIYNNPTTTKSRKPFKISDIHKLQTTLPDTIIDAKDAVENEKDVFQFPKVNYCIDTHKLDEEKSNQHAYCTEIKLLEEDPEYEPNTELDLEPIHLLDIDLEPSKDYGIDQTMFDPKTLLQCVADDDSDEIVPPPPEFSDATIYSPRFDQAEVSIADYKYTQDFEASQFDSNKMDMEHNESIFDIACASDLTPSREIETWNLSNEDFWEPSNSNNLSPFQSYTVMRKNTNIDCNYSQNSVMPRQVRLGKFKYSQKNKFKVQK